MTLFIQSSRSIASSTVLPPLKTLLVARPATVSLIASKRGYATQTSLGTTTTSTSSKTHRRVTVFNDDGQVKWGDLTPMEKVSRTTQQSFNFSLIAGGAVLTVCTEHIAILPIQRHSVNIYDI